MATKTSPKWNVRLITDMTEEFVKAHFAVLAILSYEAYERKKEPCVVVLDFDDIQDDDWPKMYTPPFRQAEPDNVSDEMKIHLTRAMNTYKGPENSIMVIGDGYNACCLAVFESPQTTPLELYNYFESHSGR